MAYTPINWQTGDTITADKMNKMDNGWGVADAQLFSDTVTMTDSGGYYYAELSYSGLIDADSLTVTFDGTEYVCPKTSNYGINFYGAPNSDYSVYPFGISSSTEGNYVDSQTDGTHSVAAVAAVIEAGEEFKKAVAKADPSFQIVLGQTTWEEAEMAIKLGREVYVLPYSGERVSISYVGTKMDGEITDHIACGARFDTSSQEMVTVFYHASSEDGALQ